MVDSGAIVGIIIFVIVVAAIIIVWNGFIFVQEKQNIIVERFGKYHSTLSSGLNWIIPIVDRPKPYKTKVFVEKFGRSVLETNNTIKISLANVVLDPPLMKAITRDNATLELDYIANYQIVSPREMIYSVINPPLILTKLIQAQMRNLAATLTIDQIIEESTLLNSITGTVDSEVFKWGIKVLFVKVQKVEIPGMESILEKQKKAQLNNIKIITDAKAAKQSMVIESEGQRDGMIRSQEGKTSEIISQARGIASSIVNIAKAEQRSIREIAGALEKEGANPVKYLLSLKYIDAMRSVLSNPKTQVIFYPEETGSLQVMQDIGIAPFFDIRGSKV